MQNPRIFLWIALALVLWLNYEAWIRDYPPASAVAAGQTPAAAAKPNDLSATLPQAAMESGKSALPTRQTKMAAPELDAGVVHVRTDVLDLDISRKGGTLQRVDLLRYPQVKGGQVPVRLMNTDSPDTLYLLQTGLVGAGDSPHPTHLAPLESDRSDYSLGSASELRVPLKWTDGQGVEVTKTYIFRRGGYRIDIEYDIANHSPAAWEAAPYAQIFRNDPPRKSSMFDVQSRAFHGPALWDGTKYRKMNITDADDSKLRIEVTNGWVAALQHHFVSAIEPPKDGRYLYTLSANVSQ
jgi:YidC/Oxa1 family membrane protein insertase